MDEITLDHNDTPQERARKVWSAMGFTQVWDKPVAKLAEALGAYRDMDRQAMVSEMTPLVMKTRAELVEARKALAIARGELATALAASVEGR